MARARSLEERIEEQNARLEKMHEKAKQCEAQIKQLEKRKKEDERKQRTRRLITIGGIAESVLGREFQEGDRDRFLNFLKAQEARGNFYSSAMNRDNQSGKEEM